MTSEKKPLASDPVDPPGRADQHRARDEDLVHQLCDVGHHPAVPFPMSATASSRFTARRSIAMWDMGNTSDKPTRKSARVVGEVMGKYHPHGDASIYDTIVKMAQPFSYRHMLVQGQGNFGSVDGDTAAASRYTEVRLFPYAEALLEDLDKDTVKFIPNYDESLQEPTVLPAKIPNLLVNGTDGIAVGMATKMPPHNLEEVCTAVSALSRQPGGPGRGPPAHHAGPGLPDRRHPHGCRGGQEHLYHRPGARDRPRGRRDRGVGGREPGRSGSSSPSSRTR